MIRQAPAELRAETGGATLLDMWTALEAELDLWSRLGRTAEFWWRDDDAKAATPQLERLIGCAQGVPLAIAVIPARAQPQLAARLASLPSVCVLQHGWDHANHNLQAADDPGDSGLPNEYPASRPDDEVRDEIVRGHQVLTDLFGGQNLPVFAPPWHGFADARLALLAEAGLMGISRLGPRSAEAAGGLAVSNVHVSIRTTRPPEDASDDDDLRRICDHLRSRRTGAADPREPTGLLTHHIRQGGASMQLMARLAPTISEHPAARWLDAREVFGL